MQDFQHPVLIEGVWLDKTGILIIIPARDADDGGLMVESTLQLLCKKYAVLPVCGQLIFFTEGGGGPDSAAGLRAAFMENLDWWQKIADKSMAFGTIIFVDQLHLVAEK